MKVKIVIALQLGGNTKKCSKALKIGAGFPGVMKASLEKDKSKITVEGEGINAVKLVEKLKSKLGFAELVMMKKADENDKYGEKEKGKYHNMPMVYASPSPYGGYVAPQQYYYDYGAAEPYNNTCAIM